MTVCYTHSTAMIVSGDTLETIDKLTLHHGSSIQIYQFLKNDECFCLVLKEYYDTFRVRF